MGRTWLDRNQKHRWLHLGNNFFLSFEIGSSLTLSLFSACVHASCRKERSISVSLQAIQQRYNSLFDVSRSPAIVYKYIPVARLLSQPTTMTTIYVHCLQICGMKSVSQPVLTLYLYIYSITVASTALSVSIQWSPERRL